MTTTTQKKTSFSELSSLLQGSNHTQLRHSRQPSLKTAKSLYTVPEVKAETSGSESNESKQRTNRFQLTNSSHQLLSNIRSKKHSQTQCVIISEQKQERKGSAQFPVNGGVPLRKTFSNPINRFEYQKTYTVRPKSSSTFAIPTVNTLSSKSSEEVEEREEAEEEEDEEAEKEDGDNKGGYLPESSSKPRKLSPSPIPGLQDEVQTGKKSNKTFSENYVLQVKFEDSEDKLVVDTHYNSATSSNQSPLTKKVVLEQNMPISRRDSLTLEQFNSDLKSNQPLISQISRTQLKMDQLRSKSSDIRNSIHTADDIISLLNQTANSSLSSNSLSPQKDVWKVTAQGKFWLNSDLSTNLMYQQLNLQYQSIQRLNVNKRRVLVSKLTELLRKLEKKGSHLNQKSSSLSTKQRKEMSPDSTTSLITLEDFVSLNALTHLDEFPDIKDERLKAILIEGRKSSGEVWEQCEQREFVSYEPNYSNYSKNSNPASLISNRYSARS